MKTAANSRTVGILILETCAETGYRMVHLPYLATWLSIDQIRLIWKHLTLHLEIPTYIAYINNNKLGIQYLAECMGFEKVNDTWVYQVRSSDA